MKLSRETLSTLVFGILALALIPFLFGRFQEWQADQEHQAVVHYDDSYFFDSERPQTKRPKSMEIRNFNGEVIWVEGDSKEMEAFVNDLLERLEKARSHVKEAAGRDVKNSFNHTFTSRAEDIERFTGSLIVSLSKELVAKGGGAAIGPIEPGLGTTIGLVVGVSI